jgi:transcription-repair coupling factor (superfamily II helicase)
MVKYLSFFGSEALIIRSLNKASEGAPYCLFCTDNEEIDKQEKIINFISPQLRMLKFPQWDCKPYDVISPSRKVVYERLKCLSEIKKADVIITTYDSLIQKVIPKDIIESGLVLSFKRGQEFGFETAIRKLAQIGFHRMMNAIEVGEFAVRGSIIDVVSEEGGVGYRLDFFGNRLETIRSYDVVNQNSIGRVEEIFITPMSEITLTEESKKRFKLGYVEHFGVGNDILEESVAAGKLHNGIEHFLPLFYDNLSTFSDYLPKNVKLVLKHDYNHKVEELYEEVIEKFKNRESLKNSIIKPLEVDLLYSAEIQNIEGFKKVLLSPFERESDIFQKSPYENLFLRAKKENVYALEFFKLELQKHNTQKVLVCCYTASSLERMQKLLLEYEMPSVIVHSLDEVKAKYSVTILPIERGFTYNGVTFVSELELLGHVPSKDKKARKKTKDIFNELLSINIGELVVHVDLGIGRFEGLEQIKVAGTVHDFIRVKYAGGDKFYLPVENLDLLTKYGVGDDNLLDKLGAVGWQSRKAKLKERIKESAEKLLKLAAQRSSSVVMPIIPIKEFYNEFVQKFQYVETEDQINSIDAVLKDLADTKPMDRLICGDVGFGKTEVALRAAAAIVSAQSTAQVAILVPTTLLARQHFKTFCERFTDFNTKIGQLSKFSPKSSVKPTKEALANGSMNIVVGTHMLLSQSIKFKNLKLLIIDEEQHFGVAQKEKLKELKNVFVWN